jgi:hypothetical protein
VLVTTADAGSTFPQAESGRSIYDEVALSLRRRR